MPSLKLLFAGTPDFAAQHLNALAAHGHHICAVYTQPDRRQGRGKKILASPVKETALQLGIPVYQPLRLSEPEVQQQLRDMQADLMIVVAYGLILPLPVLEAPRLGCLNVHASLLPRWRGAAPIERAIEAGDEQTGVCLMQMGEGLDDGPVLLQRQVSIDRHETGDSLRSKLATAGCELLLTGLAQLADNAALDGQVQNDAHATYAHKLSKAEAGIDWQQPAPQLERKIRAFISQNPCFFNSQNQSIKIWGAEHIQQAHNLPPGQILAADKNGINVACGTDVLRLLRLQFPGGKVLTAQDILNGRAAYFDPGTRLE